MLWGKFHPGLSASQNYKLQCDVIFVVTCDITDVHFSVEYLSKIDIHDYSISISRDSNFFRSNKGALTENPGEWLTDIHCSSVGNNSSSSSLDGSVAKAAKMEWWIEEFEECQTFIVENKSQNTLIVIKENLLIHVLCNGKCQWKVISVVKNHFVAINYISH